MSMNQITLIGNLGKDPQVVVIKEDLKVVKFSIACNTSRKKGSEYEKTTTWYNISVFGKKGEWFSENASKGSQTLVIGTLKPREWIDEDGKTRTSFDIEDVSTLQLLEKPVEKDTNSTATVVEVEDDSKMPF